MAHRILLVLAAAAAALVAPAVAYATPVNTTPPSISAPVSQVGAPFSVDPGTWTGPGPLRYAYAWSRCTGPNPADCGVPTAVDDGDYYVPTSGTVRVKVSVTVIDATNSASSSIVTSGPITAQGAGAPGTTMLPDPRITPAGPNQTAGTVFSASSDGWAPAAGTYEFRWFRCGPGGTQCRYLTTTAPDTAGTRSSYMSVAADAGSQLEILITGIATDGTRTSKFSGPTPFVMPAVQTQIVAPVVVKPVTPAPVARIAAPSATKKPRIAGSARVGRTLTVRRGSWLAGPTFKYRWLRGGKPIKGATRKTYRLHSADRGKRISCRVTATNATGSTSIRTASLRVR